MLFICTAAVNLLLPPLCVWKGVMSADWLPFLLSNLITINRIKLFTWESKFHTLTDSLQSSKELRSLSYFLNFSLSCVCLKIKIYQIKKKKRVSRVYMLALRQGAMVKGGFVKVAAESLKQGSSWFFCLFRLAWYSQGPSMLSQMAVFHPFLWPSSIPLYVCPTSPLSSHYQRTLRLFLCLTCYE